jgi:hypothetical protein
MQYNIDDAIAILSRTPAVLNTLLRDLPDNWIRNNEGADTWSPYDVVGHLIHGENTDWISRLEITLSDSTDKDYTPFDRFAQLQESQGKTLSMLLDEFASIRKRNIAILLSKNITQGDLSRQAIHPKFGTVTLNQLLSTWVAHDMDHIFQIVRVIAYQYDKEVGPWKEYMRILNVVK